MVRERANCTPGRPSEGQAKHEENEKGEPPNLVLTLFKLVKLGGNRRRRVRAWWRAASGSGAVLVFFEHKSGRHPAESGQPSVRGIPLIAYCREAFRSISMNAATGSS